MVGIAIRIAAMVGLLIGVGGCACSEGALRRYEYVRVCMGVRTTVTLYAGDEGKAAEAAGAAFSRIGGLDDAMSDYRPASELMRLCDRPGVAVGVSEDLFTILEESAAVSEASEGAFDVTVGPAVGLWRRARGTHQVPDAAELERARAVIGWRMVELDGARRTVRLARAGMRLDLGGIAKGYAAQRAVEVLKREGCGRCLVALSGDIMAGDPPPGERGWRVAIESERSGKAIGTLWLANAAVSTSGDTEQFVEIDGKRYAHIVDPATGLGISTRRSVTVVSSRGEWADGLATAACIIGPERSRAMLERFAGTGMVFEEVGGSTPERITIDPEGVVRWCEESEKRR